MRDGWMARALHGYNGIFTTSGNQEWTMVGLFFASVGICYLLFCGWTDFIFSFPLMLSCIRLIGCFFFGWCAFVFAQWLCSFRVFVHFHTMLFCFIPIWVRWLFFRMGKLYLRVLDEELIIGRTSRLHLSTLVRRSIGFVLWISFFRHYLTV